MITDSERALIRYRLEVIRITAQLQQTVYALAEGDRLNDLSRPMAAWLNLYMVEMGRHAVTTLTILNEPTAVAPQWRCIFRSTDNIPRSEP